MNKATSLQVPFSVEAEYSFSDADTADGESRSATVRLDRPHDMWQAVRDALDDRAWDFRTVAGISRDTGLPEVVIEDLLDHHHDALRQRLAPDDWRTKVYTLKSRPRSWREIVSDLRFFISKSP